MILITGASGNVGQEVIKQALAVGLTIRAAFQTPSMAAKAPAGLEGVIVDYSKPETIRPALHGVEKIFLAGPANRDLSALEARFIKEVRAAAGSKHVVKLSALGGRESILASGHRDSEEHIEATGLPYTFLRPNAFMQNLVNNAGTIRSQDAFYGCQGSGAVSVVDIRDIAAVAVIILAATGHEGKSYELTGGEALTNAQMAERISQIAGRKISYIDLSPADFKKTILSAGTPEWSAEAMLDLHRFYRGGKACRVTDDVERVVGRKPITFDQFARDYAFAFRDKERVAS